MKTRILLALLFLGSALLSSAATNDLTALLQQGLFDEEANRDLPAAIADYQSLATQFDRDRQVAATAVYRLGECYRKLGQTNEATAQYQRLLHDFADQKDLVTLSRQNLTGLGVATESHFATRLQAIVKGAAGAGPATDSRSTQQDLLAQEIKVTEEALLHQQTQFQMGTLPSDALLPTQQKLLELKRQMAALETGEPVATGPTAATLGNAAAEAQLLAAELARMDQLKNDPARRALSALAMYPDDDLSKMLRHLPELQGQVNDLTDTNVTVKTNSFYVAFGPNADRLLDTQSQIPTNRAERLRQAREEWDKQLALIGQRADFIISLQQARLEVLQSVAATAAQNPASTASAAPTDEESREIVRIQQMIQNSPDLINAPGEDRRTPLAMAAINGWLKVAAYLLDHGADVNAGQVACEAALYHAAKAGNRAMVEFLLSRGADVNADCPLSVASEKGFQAVVEVLLTNKADVNEPAYDNNEHDTPLCLAVMHNHVSIAQKLVAAGANPNVVNTQGRTPLSYGAERRSPEMVKLLLAAKADPNAGKDAPLLVAIFQKDAVSAELLLQAGAKPSAVGAINFMGGGNYPGTFQNYAEHITPFWTAIYGRQLPLVQLLLKYHADPDDAQTDGQPVIFRVLSETNILAALLAAGAKVDPTDPAGNQRTPLWYAANGNNVAAVDILLKHGANPNASDQDGSTPLSAAACRSADSGIFELLLAHQADPNVRNHDGLTPLSYVKANGKLDLAALLRQHGALDQLPDWDRITASRPSANYSTPVFHKATNDVNQFTLLELIAVQCRFLAANPGDQGGNYEKSAFFNSGSEPIPFPDLAHLRVHRPAADYKKNPDLTVNLAPAFQSGDASNDLPLHWGDVVEIPEADHPLNENWPGFSDPELANLKKCLTRHVTVIVNSQTNLLTLAPGITFRDPNGQIVPVPHVNVPGSPFLPRQTSIQSTPFWLTPVLMQSKLVLASSDLAHVHVTRRDPQTGKTAEWTFDCSQPPSSSDSGGRGGFGGGGTPRPMAPPRLMGPGGRPVNPSVAVAADACDLWLRDGDVIDVPERP